MKIIINKDIIFFIFSLSLSLNTSAHFPAAMLEEFLANGPQMIIRSSRQSSNYKI